MDFTTREEGNVHLVAAELLSIEMDESGDEATNAGGAQRRYPYGTCCACWGEQSKAKSGDCKRIVGSVESTYGRPTEIGERCYDMTRAKKRA